MMLLPSIFAVSCFTTSVLAIGRAIITNQCDTPVSLSFISSPASDRTHEITLPKDSSYSSLFTSSSQSIGIALKLTSTSGDIPTPNASQLIFAYNVDNTYVWYNMSSLFGDAFSGRTVRIQPSDEACEGISWYDGRAPAGSQAKQCQRETNLELTLCTGHCLPSWSPCGKNAQNDMRVCCTHCIGSHHCVAPQ